MKHWSIIRSFYPSLSKSEKKVADYILEMKENIIYQTLQEVSKTIGVGEATIIRFCQKIGYNGFHYFKLSVEKDKMLEEDGINGSYVDNIGENIQNAIARTKEILDIDNVNRAIRYIENSDRIFIYGIGTSGNVAKDMQARLLRLGKIVTAVTDSHFQLMTSSVLNESDLIITFSLSGYTKEIYEALLIAKKVNCKIVTVTNHILSKAAEISDVVILSAAKESPMDGGSLSGRVSQLYIVDIICTGYALSNLEITNIMRENTATAVVHRNLEYKNKIGGKDG